MKHESRIKGATLDRAERLILSWSGQEVRSMSISFATSKGALGIHGSVRLWDVESGLPISERLQHHGGVVRGAVFSPDEQSVLSWGDDGTARIWVLRTFVIDDARSVKDALEIRTGTRLTSAGAVQSLSHDVWEHLRKDQ